MGERIVHLAITTPNQIGHQRRSMHHADWLSVNLEPKYIYANLPKKISEPKYLASNRLYQAQLSCTQTHRLAWKEFLSTDFEYCLITEDDASASDSEFFHSLDSLIRDTVYRNKPVIVQLGAVVFARPALSKIMKSIANLFLSIRLMKIRFRPRFVYTREFSYGTHCYLLNRLMAEVLCEIDDVGYIGLDAHLMAFLNHSLGKDICDTFRRLVPASFQRREDSNIPTSQEYLGRRTMKPTIWELIACFANSNSAFTRIS